VGHHHDAITPTDSDVAIRDHLTVTRVLWWVLSLALVALAVYIIAGRTDELSGAGSYLDNLRWYWVGLAVVLELASIVAYAALQGRLLAAGDVDVGLSPLTGITLASNSIQNSLPAGPVFSTVWAFRQFNRRGADELLSGWTLLAATVLSLITLVLMAGVGFGVADSVGDALNLGGVISGMLVFTVIIVFAWTRRDLILRSLVRPLGLVQRVLQHPKGDPRLLMQAVAGRVAAVTPGPADWSVSAGWALASWVFDAACLVVAFLAVGAPIPWRALPLAYGAAQLAANLPITPGGLGVVEGSLTIALVAYGGAHASTVAAVLVYRLISFWALLPPGWISWGVCSWTLRRAPATHLVDPRQLNEGLL
jgi:uncharacterized protein (TIRG00374 family)